MIKSFKQDEKYDRGEFFWLIQIQTGKIFSANLDAKGTEIFFESSLKGNDFFQRIQLQIWQILSTSEDTNMTKISDE